MMSSVMTLVWGALLVVFLIGLFIAVMAFVNLGVEEGIAVTVGVLVLLLFSGGYLLFQTSKLTVAIEERDKKIGIQHENGGGSIDRQLNNELKITERVLNDGTKIIVIEEGGEQKVIELP